MNQRKAAQGFKAARTLGHRKAGEQIKNKKWIFLKWWICQTVSWSRWVAENLV